jgi:formylglycine-generating enzyme required for sulfatase activity
MSTVHLISGIFFVLTAVCLFVAERFKNTDSKLPQHAARAALAFVLVAGVTLAMDIPYLGALMDPYHAKKNEAPKKKKGGGGAGIGGVDVDPEEDDGGGAGAAAGGGAAQSGDGDGDAGKEKTAEKPKSADDEEDVCETLPDLVPVEAGSGLIGAPATDKLASNVEKPERMIRVWPTFKISRNEITYQQYKCFADATNRPWKKCSGMPVPEPQPAAGASGGKKPQKVHVPATCITWQDAKAYVHWLSLKSSKVYRLPTALQWEYAAREPERDAELGLKEDDPLVVQRKIYNLGGGVAEFVSDCWINRSKPANGAEDDIDQAGQQPDFCATHVLKDGSAAEDAHARLPWSRRRAQAGETSANVGFRVIQPIGR